MATLYDELGVGAGASAEELRQAYRRRARQLHPDLRPAGDAAADEAMARLNSAWGVLGDPAERRRYDRELGLAASRERAARLIAEGQWIDHGQVEAAAPLPAPRIRPSMWFLAMGVLALIFVFTAYAADRPSPPKPGRPGQCVSPVRQIETYVPCTVPNVVGKLVVEVRPDQPCPDATFRHLFASRNVVACLTRT
jgi:curved DNA-binding protein CbpA